jgi:hypothetical protein
MKIKIKKIGKVRLACAGGLLILKGAYKNEQ